ncbi:HIT-like protein [Suhomyces tanzawaensis NRRL Y-17324]|uniref:Bis(5'-adenosyl)-triphosphatase n=1 Tax=Suhomyces tanzawaensis NRRL Y-17324 TaxID=984487 RepID=A0A1E4SIE5_9ASCO|nr:HIT-like protein [Suhomyces tanzawaensis NRRL Y-17324]ODV79286.1 HIT-like protein [Suhomyces tanzawaensis NRRL Y-17324]
MSETIHFYKWAVTSQVFFKSKYTFALVNLRPLVPGHVMVVPLRTSVQRFTDLSPEESADYMNTLQLIPKLITKVYKADSLNIAIQDGPEAGQSVPHLHTHIIPRYKTDGYGDGIYSKLERNDTAASYEEFEKRKAAFRKSLDSKSELSVPDEDRQDRTAEVMSREADWLRSELEALA